MVTRRRRVRVTAAAGCAVALLLIAGHPVSAAPGGDVLVQAKNFTVGDAVEPAGSAVIMCPTGSRAIGGGVAPLTPVANDDNFRVQVSGPVESSGATVNTDTGDVPRGWAVTVSHFRHHGDETFRVFVLCSRTSDALVQAAAAIGGGPSWEQTVSCPAGRRAVGGGVGSLEPIAAGDQAYITYASHPVDETLTTVGTVNGDVAKAWTTAMASQGGSAPRFFAICSANSDGKVQSKAFTLGAGQTGGSSLTCPAKTRALSGGLGTNSALNINSDRLEYTAPVDVSGNVGPTSTGDLAKGWVSASRNNTEADRAFRVLAICATSEPRPDAHIKRSSDAAYVGMNVYSPTAQVRAWSATRRQVRAYNLRFENDGEPDTFTIRGCASRKVLNVKYINSSTGADVTAKVAGAGYVLANVPQGAQRSLVVRLQPTTSATIGSTLSCRVTATSSLKTTVLDAVLAKLTVLKS